MRYHTYKGSHCRNLVIADLQGKELRFPNYNILSLPGGTIATVLDFPPPKDKFDTIVLFIGGNNAFNNQTPSTPPPRETARELSHLANRLLKLARKVVILGIPFRKAENNHNRARAINIEIENLKSQTPGISEE